MRRVFLLKFESHLYHTFDPQKFLADAPKRVQDTGMKTLPQNIVPFVLRGLPPLNKLDQRMMRKLRKLADLTGWTVEDLIHEGILEFVAKHEAEKELETDHQIPDVDACSLQSESQTNAYLRSATGGRRKCCRKVFCLTVSRFPSFMAAA